MLRAFPMMTALAAVAFSAADTGGAPAAPAAEPPAAEPPAGAAPPPANPAPDTKPPAAEPQGEVKASAKKSRVVVWVQPGFDHLRIGNLYRTSADQAEALRAAGRARFASEAEAKALKDIPELPGL